MFPTDRISSSSVALAKVLLSISWTFIIGNWSHCLTVSLSVCLLHCLTGCLSFPLSVSLTLSLSSSHCVSLCLSFWLCLPLCLFLSLSHCLFLCLFLSISSFFLSLSLYLFVLSVLYVSAWRSNSCGRAASYAARLPFGRMYPAREREVGRWERERERRNCPFAKVLILWVFPPQSKHPEGTAPAATARPCRHQSPRNLYRKVGPLKIELFSLSWLIWFFFNISFGSWEMKHLALCPKEPEKISASKNGETGLTDGMVTINWAKVVYIFGIFAHICAHLWMVHYHVLPEANHLGSNCFILFDKNWFLYIKNSLCIHKVNKLSIIRRISKIKIALHSHITLHQHSSGEWAGKFLQICSVSPGNNTYTFLYLCTWDPESMNWRKVSV